MKYLDTHLRTVPETIDLKPYTHYSLVTHMWPHFGATAPYDAEGTPCVTCNSHYYGAYMEVQVEDGVLGIYRIQHGSACHPKVRIAKLGSTGYVVDMMVPTPGRPRRFANKWYISPMQRGPNQWIPISVSGTQNQHMLLLPLHWNDEKKFEAYSDPGEWNIVSLFQDLGYLPPLAVCFPERVPLWFGLDATLYNKHRKKRIQGMKASIKYARTQYQIMNNHLAGLARLAKSPIQYPEDTNGTA